MEMSFRGPRHLEISTEVQVEVPAGDVNLGTDSSVTGASVGPRAVVVIIKGMV